MINALSNQEDRMQLTRRRITGGLFFGLPAAGMLNEAEAQRDGGSDAQTAGALRDIVAWLRDQGDPPVIDTIREAQRVFLRGHRRFPDYIEIGITVWEQLYDWHVHTRQALNIIRLPEGQYAMQTLLTTFVLRVDAQPTYVGPGSETL